MKYAFALFVLLYCGNTIAQSITLPAYQKGQYENDTVYTYFGALPLTGKGSVTLGGSLASAFITGVDFKIIIDSTNQGSSPSHTAFRDSLGTWVPVYQGDTLEIPVSFQLYAGEIGFRILIEGVPQIAGESYLCDLGYKFTPGDDWGLLIMENSQDLCLVDQMSSLAKRTKNLSIKVFPNPFNQNVTIEFENYSNEPYHCMLYDLLGKEVKTIQNISSNKFMIETDGLPKGTYIFQLYNKYGVMTNGKLIKE